MQVLIVMWRILPILVIIQGNIIFDNNEKLIIINQLGIPDRLDNSGSGMMINPDSGTLDGPNGSNTPNGPNGLNGTNGRRVHNNGSCICSTERQWLCTNFYDAFNLVENNTVIAINGTLGVDIIFNIRATVNNITNISIIGYHRVVEVNCLTIGSIEFNNCNNIIIENVTWIQCGKNRDSWGVNLKVARGYEVVYVNNFHDDFLNIYSNGLSFAFCRYIALKSCAFEASMVGIYEASAVVSIDQVRFLSTDAHDLYGVWPLATGLIMNHTNVNTNMYNSVVMKVTNSHFLQTECLNTCRNLLLFYILYDDPHSTIQVLVKQTDFSSASYNPGWAAENGMVWIQILSSMDAYIEFNGVKFLYNDFRPEKFPFPSQFSPFSFTAILHIFSTNSIRVKLESTTFLNNYASTVASFKGDVYLDSKNTHFCNNKADSILFLKYPTLRLQNRWLYIVSTTVKFMQSVFSNNSGGQLILFNGSYILVTISGLTVTNNYFSSGNDGFIMNHASGS